ncbi:MAG: hypothetical protein AAF282_10420 [Cyanobacteria bacterium P01_A01_bin.15]
MDIEVSSGSRTTRAAAMPSTAGFGGGDLQGDLLDASDAVEGTDGFGGGDLLSDG